MLTKIHRFFWFAYYFFFNLLTQQNEVQTNQSEKQDAMCSTLSLEMHDKKCFKRRKQRWQRKMAKVIPHVWKIVIAKQMSASCFIKKSDPKLKFIPIQLWPEVEPTLWNALVIFTCMFAAKAAAKDKAHKGTQLSKEEPISDNVEDDDKKSLIINGQNEKMEDISLGNQMETSNEDTNQENIVKTAEESEIEVKNDNLNDEKVEESLIEETSKNSGGNPENPKNEQLEEGGNLEENVENSGKEPADGQISEQITTDLGQEQNLKSEDKNDGEQPPTVEQCPPITEEPTQRQENEVLKNDANEAVQELSTSAPQVKSFESKFVQTEEDPISFYVRRISISSLKSEEDNPSKIVPTPPLPPTKTPKTITFAFDNDQEKSPEVPVKGGVSVFVPGLLDAAKNSVQRRLKARSNSPDTNNQTAKVSQTVVNNQTKTNTVNLNDQKWNSNQKVHVRQSIDSPNQTQNFVFYPKSPVGINDQIKKSGQQSNNARHEYSASPVLNSPFLLGQSVFKPVKEIEYIRNDFNQRSVSNSRSPSVVSHNDFGNSTKTNYFGNDQTKNSNVSFLGNQQQFNQNKWALRDGNSQNVVFPKLPIGITQRVFERKVTEHHIERDTSGKLYNGWKQQDWQGTYEQFRDPNQTPML
uniref:Uncharacterized protein n=1 Tax=Panagrolaimus sp. JU765 TaxID=591449 RepID=A0AC34Q2K3_9BILA